MNISYSKWLSAPLYQRAKIAQEFGIAKVRPTHVSDNKVVDDGYDLHTVESSLSVEAMQSFLKTTETDANILLENLFNWADGKYEIEEEKEEIIAILPPEDVAQFNKEYEERTGKVAPTYDEPAKPITKRGRPKKK